MPSVRNFMNVKDDVVFTPHQLNTFAINCHKI